MCVLLFIILRLMCLSLLLFCVQYIPYIYILYIRHSFGLGSGIFTSLSTPSRSFHLQVHASSTLTHTWRPFACLYICARNTFASFQQTNWKDGERTTTKKSLDTHSTHTFSVHSVFACRQKRSFNERNSIYEFRPSVASQFTSMCEESIVCVCYMSLLLSINLASSFCISNEWARNWQEKSARTRQIRNTNPVMNFSCSCQASKGSGDDGSGDVCARRSA